MIRKFARIIAPAVGLIAAPYFSGSARAAGYTAAERAAIRAMPVHHRPNRPGHFYGNTIRALVKLGVVQVHD